MKKIFTLFSFIIIIFFVGFAKEIDKETAKNVGSFFLQNHTNSALFKSSFELELVYTLSAQNFSDKKNNNDETPYLYVFNTNNHGFVIVSADDRVSPILAYSDEVLFNRNDIPKAVAKWLEQYKNEIRFAIENNIPATEEIQDEWRFLIYNIPPSITKGIESVDPLAQAKWDQGTFYNSLCPGNSVVGCVATAMGIIMKYWNYPPAGSGFHSYNHNNFGTISANFGNSTYNWNSMPNSLNAPNNEVATISFHLGVSVNMDYSPQVSNAYVISSASPIQNCSEYALKTYFGYKNTMQGIQRQFYGQNEWIGILKNELDNERPILYAGFGSGGGHAFVCDGYDANNFFHFNWGWGGAFDGYFTVNALNPDGLGIGGGTGGYNSGQQALIGIEPPSNNQIVDNDIVLNNFLLPSSNSISYGQGFNVSTNVLNAGSSNFSGDFGLAVFDQNLTFIDFVDVFANTNLLSGNTYNNNLIFQTSGLLSMLPGVYYLSLYYKPNGENWKQVGDNGSFTNVATMNVFYSSNIELNADMNVSPGAENIVAGQAISVNLNIINDGSTTFFGQYGLGLYNADGSLAQEIQLINENNGLQPNFTYLDPFLTFSNSSVNVAPGNYLMALQHNQNNSGWFLSGSSYYQNPIRVKVIAAPLGPDQYEPNNTAGAAYVFPVNFSGNQANIKTSGANLHIESDYDFYKISLPSGEPYTISARLHDSYNSGDGNTYSVDALFSYSTNGTDWSDIYDDVMPNNIVLENGGDLYFHVAPYFVGYTGTYALELNVSKGITNISQISEVDLVSIYPNPAKDILMVDSRNLEITAFEVIDIKGKTLLKQSSLNEFSFSPSIDVSSLSEGLYIVRLLSESGWISKKIIIGQ